MYGSRETASTMKKMPIVSSRRGSGPTARSARIAAAAIPRRTHLMGKDPKPGAIQVLRLPQAPSTSKLGTMLESTHVAAAFLWLQALFLLQRPATTR